MSDQPGPSSSRRREDEPPEDSDEEDSDFVDEEEEEEGDDGEDANAEDDDSQNPISDSGSSEDDYERGSAVCTYEMCDRAAKLLEKFGVGELDFKLEPTSPSAWLCSLTTTPDTAQLHDLLVQGLNLVCKTWPFNAVLEEKVKKIEEEFGSLFVEGLETLVILIELRKIFDTQPPKSLEDVQKLIQDPSALLALELTIRNVLEYDDYVQLDLGSILADVKWRFEDHFRWKQAAKPLFEKNSKALITAILRNRQFLPSPEDMLELRLVSKDVKDTVDGFLVDQQLYTFKKKVFGVLDTSEKMFADVEYQADGEDVRHVDVRTAVQLLKIVPVTTEITISLGFTSANTRSLVDKWTSDRKLEFPVRFERTLPDSEVLWTFVQGPMPRRALDELLQTLVKAVQPNEESKAGALKRKMSDCGDETLEEKRTKLDTA